MICKLQGGFRQPFCLLARTAAKLVARDNLLPSLPDCQVLGLRQLVSVTAQGSRGLHRLASSRHREAALSRAGNVNRKDI